MEDYEIENAREWDLQKGGGSWQGAGGSKKQQKAKVSVPPAQNAPSKHNWSDKGTHQEDFNGRKALPQVSGCGRFGVLQEAADAASQTKQANENTAPQRPQVRLSRQTASQAYKKHGGKQLQPKPPSSGLPVPAKKSHQQSQEQQYRQRQKPQKQPKQQIQQRNGRQKRPAPRMGPESDGDNAAEKQWRRQEPAQAHIRIPINLAESDKGHFDIAKRHETFMFHGGVTKSGSTAEFGIWGDPTAVQETIKDITSWISEFHKRPQGNPKFAKVCSLTDPLRLRAEKRWKKEVKKQRFRQFPPPDKTFEAIGSFYWPVKEYKPAEILGSCYEALDPIRMEHECYVVFEDQQGLFNVMGKVDSVRQGLLRLRRTFFQIVAQTTPAWELYVLYDADRYNGVITLADYERNRAISGELSAKYRVAKSPVGIANDEGLTSTKLTGFSNEEKVRRSIISALKKLHYYRGSIQMRVRFGTFLATQYMQAQDGCYAIDQYRMMIQQSAFRGEVTQELGDKQAEINILSTLEDAVDLLVPQDAMTRNLSSVKPLHQAIITFVDPINSELGDIRLTMIWQEQQDWNSSTPTYEQVSKKWTRLDRDTQAPISILGATLCSITGAAYQFEINAATSIEEDKLPKGYAEYGNSIRPDPKAAQKATKPTSSDMSFLLYRSSFQHLKSLEQRLTYRYGIKGSDYTLELVRFQHKTFSPKENLFVASTAPTIYEARWGLSFYRIEWDTMFAQNERLPIGERTDWSEEEAVWFPKDYADEDTDVQGFAGMMSKLKRIQNLVKDAADEDLIGGMRVG